MIFRPSHRVEHDDTAASGRAATPLRHRQRRLDTARRRLRQQPSVAGNNGYGIIDPTAGTATQIVSQALSQRRRFQARHYFTMPAT